MRAFRDCWFCLSHKTADHLFSPRVSTLLEIVDEMWQRERVRRDHDLTKYEKFHATRKTQVYSSKVQGNVDPTVFPAEIQL